MAWAGGGHPGMTGRGPGSGTSGMAGVSGMGPGPAGATGIGGSASGLGGHPGMAGGAAGQHGGLAGGQTGIGGSASGLGGHPGMVGGGAGQHGGFGGFGGMNGGFGGGSGHPGMVGNAAGDRGFAAAGTASYGPSRGNYGGHPGMADNDGNPLGLLGNIGLANFGSIADAVHGWGRGQSVHAMDPSEVGPRSDLGELSGRFARDHAMNVTRGDDGSTHSRGVSERGLAHGDMISADRVNQAAPPGFFGRDIGAQMAARGRSQGGFPARGALANPDPGPRGEPAPSRDGFAATQDPGPRGMPAPGLPSRDVGFRHSNPAPAPVGPRHSSPTPTPVSQDRPFNVRDDFGPIADTVFGGLRRANDMMSGMNARAGFQRGRVGGVGGGPRAGDRAQRLGQLLFDRGK